MRIPDSGASPDPDYIGGILKRLMGIVVALGKGLSMCLPVVVTIRRRRRD